MEKRDILWIDYVKFIGITLVILGHTMSLFGQNSDINIINKYINMFHMPLFFLIGGYLYKNKTKTENYTKILRGLLIPYIVYQLIYFPFLIGKVVIVHHTNIFITILKGILGILIGANVPEPSFFINVCGPCWFILVMIQLRFLFNNFNLSIKNLSLLALCSFITLKLLSIYQTDLYFCLDNLFMAIPYFILGYVIKLKNADFIEKFTGIKKISVMTFCFILVFLVMKMNGVVRIADLITSLTPETSLISAYIGGISGTFAVCLFSTYFNHIPEFIKTISRNTLFIIFFHYFIIFFENIFRIKNIIFNLYTNSGLSLNSAAEYILKMCIIVIFTAISLILNYIVIKILERKHSWVLGKYYAK